MVTGSGACPAGFTSGNEQAINNTYSASSIGLKNFADLQVIFNPVEPQNAAGQTLTIDDLALTLWNPTNGTLLATYKIAAPYVIQTQIRVPETLASASSSTRHKRRLQILPSRLCRHCSSALRLMHRT